MLEPFLSFFFKGGTQYSWMIPTWKSWDYVTSPFLLNIVSIVLEEIHFCNAFLKGSPPFDLKGTAISCI